MPENKNNKGKEKETNYTDYEGAVVKRVPNPWIQETEEWRQSYYKSYYKKYYETLGVDEEATPEAIEKVYQSLILQWHPDKNPDKKEEAEAKFRKIKEAYEVLGNKCKKIYYDLGWDWRDYDEELLAIKKKEREEAIKQEKWEQELKVREYYGEKAIRHINKAKKGGAQLAVGIDDLDANLWYRYEGWKEKIWAMGENKEINYDEFMKQLNNFENQMLKAIETARQIKKEKNYGHLKNFKVEKLVDINKVIRSEASGSSSTNNENETQNFQTGQVFMDGQQYGEIAGEWVESNDIISRFLALLRLLKACGVL